MDTPREIKEAVAAADALRFWLQRIAERTAQLLEEQARAIRDAM